MSLDIPQPVPAQGTTLEPIRPTANKRVFIDGYNDAREREQELLGDKEQLQAELRDSRRSQTEAWTLASAVTAKLVQQIVLHTRWELTGTEHYQHPDGGPVTVTLRFHDWRFTVNAARGLLAMALPGKLEERMAEIDGDGLTDSGLLTFLGYLAVSNMPAETRRTLPARLTAKLCTQAVPPAATPRIVARSRPDNN